MSQVQITNAVCDLLGKLGTALVLVDEIHLLNHATIAGEDLSDHLKYFTEHLPATFVYAGINVEQSGLFNGIRGKQLAGRCVLVRTGPFPPRPGGGHLRDPRPERTHHAGHGQEHPHRPQQRILRPRPPHAPAPHGMNMFRPALIRPLPIPLPPFPDECESSYWTRLAQANHVPLARLRAPSRWLESRLPSVDALCLLSSQSRQHLSRTISDLYTGGLPPAPPAVPDDHVLRWACRRCVVARTGWNLPAQVWASIHDNVCLRRNLWIGKDVFARRPPGGSQLDIPNTSH
jgi:hypothetical protein